MDELQLLAQQAGIHLPRGMRIEKPMGLDAQPVAITSANGGIPAYLTNYVDPQIITALIAPMKAAEIAGETKKGDWVTDSGTWMLIEPSGETSSYGDYSNDGNATAQVNYPQRQTYHYQVVTRWGDRELDQAALSQVDWATQINLASVLTLNKFQNKTYFFGVQGLQNYGLLNDPSLSAPITTTTPWAQDSTDGQKVYDDVRRLFKKLAQQCNGTVDMSTPMILALSPVASVDLNKTNQYNVNTIDQLKKNFPNLEIVTAPEYSTTGAGELVQLMVKTIDGQATATCGFTEKMRAHPIVRELSSYKQKKTQGTWGCIVFRPFAIAQLIVS